MPIMKSFSYIPKRTYRKKKIPTALRNQVWINHMGERFRVKCPTSWCQTTITPFTFEAGHNIPESKGGQTVVENLIPICSTCNKSMGNSHTFTTWSSMYTLQNQTSHRLPQTQTTYIPVVSRSKRTWNLFSCFFPKKQG